MKSKGRAQAIGITGGIGSGKSRVCSYLAQLCRFPVIDLDLICKQLLLIDAPGWLGLKQILGDHFFFPSGEIERRIFRNALFADAQLRKRVDVLLHPLARAEMAEQVDRTGGSVLIEIPLLFEAGWQDDVQLIVVVYADPAVRLQRIVSRDNVSNEQAQQAIAAQHSLLEKALLAEHVIDNSGNWQATCLQVQDLADCLGCR